MNRQRNRRNLFRCGCQSGHHHHARIGQCRLHPAQPLRSHRTWSRLSSSLPVLKEHGTHAENVRMFVDGNYVFMHNIWKNAKPFGADEMVAFDIIRVDENGKVAEHWDAMTVLVIGNCQRQITNRWAGHGKRSGQNRSEQGPGRRRLIEDVLMGKDPGKMRRIHQLGPAIPPAQSGDQGRVEWNRGSGGIPHLTEQHVQVHPHSQGAGRGEFRACHQ
jgi:hypothetical protein